MRDSWGRWRGIELEARAVCAGGQGHRCGTSRYKEKLAGLANTLERAHRLGLRLGVPVQEAGLQSRHD